MNSVLMTIINPQKEYWPSQGLNQLPYILKSCMQLTTLYRLWDKNWLTLVLKLDLHALKVHHQGDPLCPPQIQVHASPVYDDVQPV